MAELGLVERFRIIAADGGTHPFIYQLTKGGFHYAQSQRGPDGALRPSRGAMARAQALRPALRRA